MDGYWLAGHKTYRLKSRWTTIDFEKNNRQMRLNGNLIYLGYEPLLDHEVLYVARDDILHVLQPILTPQVFGPAPALRRIVLDPGHGGTDQGAKSQTYGLLEKALTLDLCLRLKRRLEQVGYEVVLTRENDRKLELAERPLLANRANADLFISLHFNAAQSSTAEGVECFTLTPSGQRSSYTSQAAKSDAIRYPGNRFDSWNTLLAYHLQDSLLQGTKTIDRGVKRARFAVLKNIQCPAVLIELGFVSHDPTALRLQSEHYRESLARSVFDGIVAYSKRFNRTAQ